MVQSGMKKRISDEIGLREALVVAKSGSTTFTSEGDAKLLGFFLRKGECTAEISESRISVWYSWLQRPFPSTYFKSLAPGLVRRLLDLGEVQSIVDEAIFQVGPGRTGTGQYIFEFKQKWVRIQCEKERIAIRIRDDRKNLDDPEPKFSFETARCQNCNGELRTPLAKQCLHCGYDWH